MRLVHVHSRRQRATGAFAIIAIVLGSLAVQFFRVQVLQSNDYVLQSLRLGGLFSIATAGCWRTTFRDTSSSSSGSPANRPGRPWRVSGPISDFRTNGSRL